MKQILRLLLGIIPCLLLACDYSPSGSHFEEMDPHVMVTGDIQLDNFPEQDTLRLRGTVNLRFSISLPGRTIYSYKLMLGSKELGTGTSVSAGGHELQTTQFEDGYYRLQLSAVGSSNTGSLADKAGAEGVEVYRTWVVHFDNSSKPAPVALTSLKAEDGQLKLRWEKYKGSGFLKYEVSRQLHGQNYQVVATITNPSQTTWADETYLGGQASYWVTTYVNGIYYGLVSEAMSCFYPQPQVLSSTRGDDNALKIIFSSTPFYSNFGSYELTLNFNSPISITNSQDTVFTIPAAVFGEDFHATLATYPKAYPAAHAFFVVDYAILPGLGAPWGPQEVEHLFGKPSSGKLYFSNTAYIRVVDAVTRQVLRERDVMYNQIGSEKQDVISQDGKIMYSIQHNAIHKLDPLTLQTLESYEVHELLPEEFYHFSMLDGVSNTNRLILRARNAEYQPDDKDHAYVIDMARKKVETAVEADLSYGYSTISPDGKTINASDKVYVERSNGTWEKLPFTTQEANTLKYHATKQLFFTTKGTTVSFYSTTDGTLQSKLQTEREFYELDTDPVTGNLYGFNANQLHVFDSSTGQLIKKIEVKSGTPIFLYNNTLYSGNRYLKL